MLTEPLHALLHSPITPRDLHHSRQQSPCRDAVSRAAIAPHPRQCRIRLRGDRRRRHPRRIHPLGGEPGQHAHVIWNFDYIWTKYGLRGVLMVCTYKDRRVSLDHWFKGQSSSSMSKTIKIVQSLILAEAHKTRFVRSDCFFHIRFYYKKKRKK